MSAHLHVHGCMHRGQRAALALSVLMPLPFCLRQCVIGLELCLVGQGSWPSRSSCLITTGLIKLRPPCLAFCMGHEEGTQVPLVVRLVLYS